MCVCVCAHVYGLLQEKLLQAIKRIKHEVDECKEAEREAYIDSVEVEVLLLHYPFLDFLSLTYTYVTSLKTTNQTHEIDLIQLFYYNN